MNHSSIPVSPFSAQGPSHTQAPRNVGAVQAQPLPCWEKRRVLWGRGPLPVGERESGMRSLEEKGGGWFLEQAVPVLALRV